MTLDEVRDEIVRLENIERELEEKEREAHRNVARRFVGKCFESSGGVVIKIIGIPRTILRMRGSEYNEYQFPAVFLKCPDQPDEVCFGDGELDKILPFYCDTIYFNIDCGIPGCAIGDTGSSWKEITVEEFNIKLEKYIVRFKELINA